MEFCPHSDSRYTPPELREHPGLQGVELPWTQDTLHQSCGNIRARKVRSFPEGDLCGAHWMAPDTFTRFYRVNGAGLSPLGGMCGHTVYAAGPLPGCSYGMQLWVAAH